MKGIFTLAIILCSFSIVSAQEELSLSDALQVALKQNFDIRLTERAIEINQVQNSWGQAGRYPTVSMNLTQGNNISDQSNNPTSFIQELLMSNSIQGGVNVNWVLFNGFKVNANKEKLEKLEEQSEGNAALVVQNTIQGVILAYYQAKLQSEKMVLLKDVLELSREKWEYQEMRQELGVALTIDLLQYESAYYTDSTNLLMQELAYKNAIRNLNLLMGVNETMSWKLVDKLEIERPLYDFNDLKNKMLNNNQTVKNEIINMEILGQDIELAKSTMYPVVAFNAGTTVNQSSYKIADYPRASGATLNYFANFTLNFTLYDGGKVKRGIKMLEIQNEVNEIQLDKLKSNLSNELLTQYDFYLTRIKIFDLSKEAFRVAQKNFDIAKLKENSGLINSFVLRDIETSYLRAGLAMIESGYNLIESQTNISRLTGGLLEQ
ncbi:MAG: TolC family protein [Flavobacteriales bacterium]|nr:TolC family protein [Flavobacteriales bacterium]MCB9198526.1 TolC family protein [Flavobacteriales bacterium]